MRQFKRFDVDELARELESGAIDGSRLREGYPDGATATLVARIDVRACHFHDRLTVRRRGGRGRWRTTKAAPRRQGRRPRVIVPRSRPTPRGREPHGPRRTRRVGDCRRFRSESPPTGFCYESLAWTDPSSTRSEIPTVLRTAPVDDRGEESTLFSRRDVPTGDRYRRSGRCRDSLRC
jgi:hypothetical protein